MNLVSKLLDVGHHEAARGVHGHRDVVAAVDGVARIVDVPELRVHLRVVIERQGDGLQHEGRHGDLRAILLQGQLLSSLLISFTATSITTSL